MNTNIKKPMAYFCTMQKNADKNEFRSNHNARKHILYAGNTIEQMATNDNRNEALDAEVAALSVESWIMLVEDECLHGALCKLRSTDIQMLFLHYAQGHTQLDIAKKYGVSRGVINRKLKRIHKFIKKVYEDAYKRGV